MSIIQNSVEKTLLERQKELEEEEKKRKRDKIQSEIDNLKSRITDIDDQIKKLTLQRDTLDTYLKEWVDENASEIVSQVVIENKFEGVCAEKIKSDLETCISQMDLTCDKVRGLIDKVNKQITKLNTYEEIMNISMKLLVNNLSLL